MQAYASPTLQRPSISEHGAAAPAAVSAHNQLTAARFPMLLQHVIVGYLCCLRASLFEFVDKHLASPLEPDELQGTDQVWDVAGGGGVADRYPKSDISETVRFSKRRAQKLEYKRDETAEDSVMCATF